MSYKKHNNSLIHLKYTLNPLIIKTNFKKESNKTNSDSPNRLKETTN